jgi:transcriptional/translational regulatory protein YebC/TACO1
MSGHNKWSKIHRKKGLADAEKGDIYARLSKEILVAVKQGGNGDPAQNSKLREILIKARSNNMPNDNVKRAIAKAMGDTTANNYEHILYEGYGPAGVAVMVEALTNNKNRTAGDIRSYFDKAGGALGVSGAVSYMFERHGVITIDQTDFTAETDGKKAKNTGAGGGLGSVVGTGAGVSGTLGRGSGSGGAGALTGALTADKLFELLIDAPIDDITADDGVITVTTSPVNFDIVLCELEKNKIKTTGANIEYVPTITVTLPDDKSASFERLIENLENNEDVQAVYHNAE